MMCSGLVAIVIEQVKKHSLVPDSPPEGGTMQFCLYSVCIQGFQHILIKFSVMVDTNNRSKVNVIINI